MTRSPAFLKIATILCFVFALTQLAFAHLGPPFPILVDQSIPGYLVTVLANPDVGQAIFIVVLEPVKSAPQGPVSGVDVWTQPLTGRLPKAVYPAKEESMRGNLQFVAHPDIDMPEMLKVGIDIHFADGSNHSLTTQVESTPPGVGRWGVLFFLFPFILFGGLFGMALFRRSRGRRASRTTSLPPTGAGIANLAGAKRQ
jgi:hypothetical protein